MKIINRLDIFIFAIIGLSLVITLFQPEFHALAVGNSVTSVSAPAQPVNLNQQFSVSILVQPNSPISGAQFNLSFNPALATINSITEGNLFNQNGASTYFLGGTINNTAGTVSGVAAAIIGAGKNVSASGSLAVINMTARTTGGTSALNLSNVILADANGQSVPVNTVNGQVVINGTTTSPTTTTTNTTTTTTTHTTTTTVTTAAPTISPAPPSGGSGGGGGGGGGGAGAGLGGPTSVAGVMDVSNIINSHGVFGLAVSPWSDDKKTVMVIDNGTTALTSAGTPLTQISIQHLNVAPAFPAGAGIVSLGYNFLPSDAKITPSSIVRLQYDPKLIPPDVLETSLQVAYFDTAKNKWVSLPSEVDVNNHFITTPISSFAFYAVTYGVKNTEQVLITSTTTTPSTPPTQTTSTVMTTTSALTTTSSASTTTTTTMAVMPVSTPAGTTTTAAPRVVRMSLLAVTIAVDAILIIGVVTAIVFIRRKLLKNG